MHHLVPEVRVAEQRVERLDVDRPAALEAEPVGWFIQPLTVITISDPLKPAMTTGIPASMCARGDSRSQP